MRVIIHYKGDVLDKIREYGRVLYKSELVDIIGADIPRSNLEKIKKIKGVKGISLPGKADILS